MLVGILPGFVIDALAPVMQALVGGAHAGAVSAAWLSLVPIAASRSSYNGLLVFLFIAASASLAAYAIHRLASRRRCAAHRPGIAAFQTPSPSTQYTATSFAEPIRRVFGTVAVPRPRAGRDAAARRDARRRGSCQLHDLVWDTLYAPLGCRPSASPPTGSIVLQFLTIRRYLSLVIRGPVVLLLVLAIWR